METSLNMNASAIFQTELLKVPTQLLVIDLTSSEQICKHFQSVSEIQHEFISFLPIRSSTKTTRTDIYTKGAYIESRPRMLETVRAALTEQLFSKTKGRVALFFVASSNDTTSMNLLKEFPIDVNKMIRWQNDKLAATLRMLFMAPFDGSSTDIQEQYIMNNSSFENIINSSTQAIEADQKDGENLKVLLEEIHLQFFDSKCFTQVSSNEEEIDPMVPIDSTKQKSSPVVDTDTTEEYGRISQYDVLALLSSFESLCQFLQPIFTLHAHESNYLKQHSSKIYGSGGYLFLLNKKLVTSVSEFRRIDWLIFAQVSYLQRLWIIKEPKDIQEYLQLLDYRFWVGRFDRLNDDEKKSFRLVSYPDSPSNFLDNIEETQSPVRRKRESSWSGIEQITLQSWFQISLEYNASESPLRWNYGLSETNEFRLTQNDFSSIKELITFWQRQKRGEMCLKLIAQLAPQSEITRPMEFYKLEGYSHIINGSLTQGRQMLLEYKTYLEKLEETKRYISSRSTTFLSNSRLKSYSFGSSSFNGNNAMINTNNDNGSFNSMSKSSSSDATVMTPLWSELAAISFLLGEFESAQQMALKTLNEDHSTQISAFKTLVWSSLKTGKSSTQQEDLTIIFFSEHIKDISKSIEYYRLCVESFPNNGYFWYGYSKFLYFVSKDIESALAPSLKSYELLPTNPIILEWYASCLFENRSPGLSNIMQLFNQALQLNPSSVTLNITISAFNLFYYTLAASKDDPDPVPEAFRRFPSEWTSCLGAISDEDISSSLSHSMHQIDHALFSTNLKDDYSQRYLECWFYKACYAVDADTLNKCLRTIKSSLINGLRHLNMDLSIHLFALKRNGFIEDGEFKWIKRLLQIMESPSGSSLDLLNPWKRWSDILIDKNLANSFNITRTASTPLTKPQSENLVRPHTPPFISSTTPRFKSYASSNNISTYKSNGFQSSTKSDVTNSSIFRNHSVRKDSKP